MTTVTGHRVPDVGTVPPMASAAPRVGSLVVTRVCGLPVDVLDELAAPDTLRAIRDALGHQETADALAEQVADDLYDLVPTLDRAGRRPAVSLRRDVHNGRFSDRAGTAARDLAPLLDEAAGARLTEWAAAMRAARDRLAAAERALPVETRRAGEALASRLRSPDVAAGLALASPEFTRRLHTEHGAPTPDSRFARSATAYLTRTAAKTSPFSTLTTVGVTSFGAGTAMPPSRAVSSTRAIAVALLLACARHAAGLVDVRANTGLRFVDGRWWANLANYLVTDGFSVRYDELTSCELYDWLIPSLPTEPVRLADTAEPDLARRMAEIGLLQPVLPWPADTGRVFGALAGFLSDRAPASLTTAVDRLVHCETTIATTTDARRRTAAVIDARDAVGAAFAGIGRTAPAWVAGVPLCHETVTAPETGPLPDTVRDDLAEAARWLAPLTVRDPRYDQLVRCFVHRYGSGGVCTDATDFAYALLSTVDLTQPGVHSGRPAELRGHRTLGDASHAIFFQLAADDAAALTAGRYDLVVNLVHPGAAGLVARWAELPPLHATLGEFLHDWSHALHPDCRVYQVSSYPDWSDLQRPVIDTLPRLRCPGDLPDTGPAPAELSTITLAHDPATGTVQAYDRDGSPVAFRYLGTIPQHLLAGPVRLLCLLSDPWLLAGRVDRDPRWPDGATGFRPRVRQGRVVWARARWSVPAGDLPSADASASPVAFLAEVERWRRRHGLPGEVFASQLVRGPAGVVKEKPQWVGFEHPHSIWAALHQIRPDTTTVELVEALPGRGRHPMTGPDGRPVATEFVGLVRHA
jgi:hypothetical protein